MMDSLTPSSSPHEPKGNILIVDDTPANLRLLSNVLMQKGYKVRSVVDGQMALTASQTAPPDLILLDVTMPEMDGYEVCQRLRLDERTRRIPIIFISALDSTEDKLKAFQMGGVDYITKPFQIEEVLARVQTHLALHSMRQQLEQASLTLEQCVNERTRELARSKAVMERFAPAEFMRFLGKKDFADVRLGDQAQNEMVVLQVRSRGPTAHPQASFDVLNAYFSRIGPVIREHGGFVAQYWSDGLAALFPGSPDDALCAALALHQAIHSGGENPAQDGVASEDDMPAAVNISLHLGVVSLGIIGEAQRWQAALVSGALDLVGRLDELPRTGSVSTLLTGQLVERLQNPTRFHLRRLDKMQIIDGQELVSVFELLGMASGSSSAD